MKARSDPIQNASDTLIADVKLASYLDTIDRHIWTYPIPARPKSQ